MTKDNKSHWQNKICKFLYKLAKAGQLDYFYAGQENQTKDIVQHVSDAIFPMLKDTTQFDNEESLITLPTEGEIRAKGKPAKVSTPSSKKKLEKNLVKKPRGGKRDKGVRAPKERKTSLIDSMTEDETEQMRTTMVDWFVRDLDSAWEDDLAQCASGIFINGDILMDDMDYESAVWNWVGRSLATQQGI